MKQAFCRVFPWCREDLEGLSILKEAGTVTYFVGGDNYPHALGDRRERFKASSLMANRHVRAAELERSSLSIRYRTLMNWMAQYREAGLDRFVEAARQKPRDDT